MKEIKDGMDLGVEGYNDVKIGTPNATNVIGQGWIAITKDNVDTSLSNSVLAVKLLRT